MNTIVMNATNGINDWTTIFFARINRTFCKIGYARAASELRRMGYTKEADSCLEILNNL